MSRATLYVGDALAVLRTLPDESVQCCVTSPPYWGLRDYGIDGQLGLEPTPLLYVEDMVTAFQEVRRVLRDDGTLWLNMGDCYATGAGKVGDHPGGGERGAKWAGRPPRGDTSTAGYRGSHTGKNSGKAAYRMAMGPMTQPNRMPIEGLKPKDLVMMPARVALALQVDGWWLRSDIIWSKPNPMPESVTDRPTKAHDYVFLLSKNQRYYYDAEAIAEPWTCNRDDMRTKGVRTGLAYLGSGIDNSRKEAVFGDGRKTKVPSGWDTKAGAHGTIHRDGRTQEPEYTDRLFGLRNARTVWEIPTKPYPGAHFATFPPELAARCIKAGSRPGDTILDPFGGSGTTAATATGLGRNAIHIDLNPEYLDLAIDRIGPILCDIKVQSSKSASG